MTKLSLKLRLLFAAGISLIGFLGLTGFALDKAFEESAIASLQERLQNHVYTLLAATEVDQNGELLIPSDLPGPLFSRPESGRYAAVISDEFQWFSPSILGTNIQFPPHIVSFDIETNPYWLTPVGELFVVSQAINWEHSSGKLLPFVFHVAEDRSILEQEIEKFRQNLWGWLIAAAVLLLVVQTFVLWWSLLPLRKMSREITLIEQGDRELLDENYPSEIQRLAFNLNRLLVNERERIGRYRKSLGDLAHSLKTPLAVIRTQLDSNKTQQNNFDILEQLTKIDDIIAYQLNRAATSGTHLFNKPVKVIEVLQEIVNSLDKVFAEKQVSCQQHIENDVMFYGDKGDLYELLGNLLENAYKWCQSKVWVTVNKTHADGYINLIIVIEDDGSGVEQNQRQKITERGVRIDQKTPGHGIGLAIVTDILATYNATFEITDSQLGGAKFIITFERHAFRSA